MSLTWDSLKEGSEVSELNKGPGVTQLVKYAAGGGDFNPLHHDYAFPQAKEIGSIIVHGRFKYAALGELVSNWLGHAGSVRKISCQYRGMDMPDQAFVCKGSVLRKWVEAGEKMVELEIWTENAEGKRTTPGAAVVVLNN